MVVVLEVVVVVAVMVMVVVVERSEDQSGLPRTRKGMKRSREYTRRVSSLPTAIGNGRVVRRVRSEVHSRDFCREDPVRKDTLRSSFWDLGSQFIFE